MAADAQTAPLEPKDLPQLLREILSERGIAAADLASFLNPSAADLACPEELPGIVPAADAVLKAVSERRRIVVFGDYDCDGVSATAIVAKALEALGASVSAFLPDRLQEGYGMSDASVSRMLAETPDVGLVVTVDNGINSVAQVAALKARGIAVVITDHHLPGETLPAADAVVDPKVAAPPRLESLCGAGVAFLLANRLMSAAKARGLYDGPKIGGPLLVLAGLATVTDVMPLQGQNRILVAEALRNFHSWAPVGLRELHARAARSGRDRMTSKDFGFMLGPRINAAGRMASGMEALRLLLAKDREEARALALDVDTRNCERKSIEQRMSDEALEKVVEGAPAQVIDLPDGHQGVAGIVAARVLERLGGTVPVCVIAGGHGSARAPDGLNIRDAFVACDAVLERYGGHAAAGGFSVKDGRVDEFRQLLCAYCQERRGDLPPASRPGEPDRWVMPHDFTREGWLSLAEWITRLEPFGEGNPEPVFGFHNVLLSEVKTMAGDRHLQVVIAGSGLRAVFWNHGELMGELRRTAHLPRDITFTLCVSDYGERHVELNLLSI